MSHSKRIFFILIVSISTINLSHSQDDVKKVLRIGLEYGNYLSTKSGSFKKEPGFTFGYLTGVNFYNGKNDIFQYSIDINYKSFTFYRTNVPQSVFNYYKYQEIYDEKRICRILELGFLPEYQHSFAEDIWVGIYVGGSIGAATIDQTENLISRTKIDTTYFADRPYLDGPYGGNGLPFALLIGVNYGICVYYKSVMIDLRFSNLGELLPGLSVGGIKTYYIQFGYIL